MDDNNLACACACDAADCGSDSQLHHKNIVLRCGTGTGLVLPLGDSGCECDSKSSWQPPALVVGTVNLNTLGMREPTVKIDFSSLINFKATSAGGKYFLGIIFQLSKICNSSKVPLATWIFEEKVDESHDQVVCCCDPNGGEPNRNIVTVNKLVPFTFNWCDCHTCPGCCTYILEIIDFDSAFIDFASITNIGINAMAV